MSDQQSYTSNNIEIIQIEIIPEEKQMENIADADEVGRNVVDCLRENGYTVRPTYDGRMGGPIFDVIVQIYHVVHDNQEVLAAFFASVAALLTLISNHKKHSEKKQTPSVQTPIEIVFQTNSTDKPLIVKAPDVKTAITMIEQFKDAYSQEIKKVSNTKIKISVPKKKPYHSH